MPTLDATPSGEAANSYATVEQAQAYMDTLVPESLTAAWDDAGGDSQAKALMMATRLLDIWFDWYGVVTYLTQALLWPRRGVYKPGVAEGDGAGGGSNPWAEPFGMILPAYEVPQRIVEATAELARQLLAGDRTADSDIESQGLKSLTAGPVSLEFGAVVAKPMPDSVVAMVSALGRRRSRSGSGALHLYRG